MMKRIFSISMLTLMIVGCGGGGGGGGGSSSSGSERDESSVLEPINVAPVASAGAKQIAVTGEEVTLDGSESSDEDGVIVSYQWSVGNKIIGTESRFSTDKFTKGVYVVTLTVVDDDGGTDEDEMTLAVMDPLPIISYVLNDTGITKGANYPTGNNSECVGETVWQQDCAFGTDVFYGTNGDGAAGFSFTKLDGNGDPLPASAGEWSCVRDNLTGLIWEVKTADGGIHDKDITYRWGGKTALGVGFGVYYDDWDELVDGSNAEQLCGFDDWRVPTSRELESLLDLNAFYPSIDTAYFPNSSGFFWSATPFAFSQSMARGVWFSGPYITYTSRESDFAHVRLVRYSK